VLIFRGCEDGISSPETSDSNHLTSSNNPEDGGIQLNRSVSVRLRKIFLEHFLFPDSTISPIPQSFNDLVLTVYNLSNV
jgi:hypothetical protein